MTNDKKSRWILAYASMTSKDVIGKRSEESRKISFNHYSLDSSLRSE